MRFVPGEFDSQSQWLNFHKQYTTLHYSYDKDRIPILESYLEAVYDITLKSDEGAQRRFRLLGKPSEMGTTQSYSSRYALN